MSLLLTLTLVVILAGRAMGGYLQESSTWNNIFYGNVCVDAPPWSAVCGWRIRITSNPALNSITAHEGIATKQDAGRLYFVENEHWNSGVPTANAEFCTQVQIAGSFGNTMPNYVNIDWDCICVNSICDPVPSVAQATTSASATTAEETSAAPTNPTVSTASSADSLYVKHAWKRHPTPASTTKVPIRLHCFLQCLHVTDCRGVGVTNDSGGYNCSFVSVDISANDLIDHSGSHFWERL